MADWAPGTRIRPIIINIEVADDGHLSHVGIGYHIVLPSGRIARDGGYTWHSPDGDYAHAPDEHIGPLRAAVDALLRAAADHEGVEIDSPRSLVQDSPVVEPGPERSPQDEALQS